VNHWRALARADIEYNAGMSRRTSRWIANVFCGICAVGAIAVGIEGARGFVEDARQLLYRTHAASSRKETIHILCGDGRFVFAIIRKEWRGDEAMPQMPERIRQLIHQPAPVANPAIATGEPSVREIPGDLYGAHPLPQPMWGFSAGHTIEDWGPCSYAPRSTFALPPNCPTILRTSFARNG